MTQRTGLFHTAPSCPGCRVKTEWFNATVTGGNSLPCPCRFHLLLLTAVPSLGCLITAIYSPASRTVLGCQHRLNAQLKTLMRCKLWLHNSLTPSHCLGSSYRTQNPSPKRGPSGQHQTSAPAALDELNSPFLSGCYPQIVYSCSKYSQHRALPAKLGLKPIAEINLMAP